LISSFAFAIPAGTLRFFGGVAGVILLFWLIRVLFDRLDGKR
jgi:hypothetical protein